MRHVLTLFALLAAAPLAAQPAISFSGSAEFGVTYDGTGSGTTERHGQFTLDIEPHTRTDNGLTIGAQTRIRGQNGRPTVTGGPRFYISTGGPQRLPRR
ncbi:MAG: porin [Pseudooceanicola sp.]